LHVTSCVNGRSGTKNTTTSFEIKALHFTKSLLESNQYDLLKHVGKDLADNADHSSHVDCQRHLEFLLTET
jgi:hypothetical protein